MMARKMGWMAAATIAGGALFGACNRGPSEREKQLEQRVQELEQQKAASPDPSAFPEVELEPIPPPSGHALAPEPATVRPAAPRASSASRPAASRPAPRTETRPAAPAPAPRTTGTSSAPAPASPGNEPVERIDDSEVARGDDDWPAGEAGARREPVPAREARAVVVPANTQLTLRLETPVSSRTSTVGDRVTARVERAVTDDGTVALPGGTVLHGRVTEADSAGRVKGKARVAVAFDRIVVRGQSHPLEATVISAIAPDSHSRDAKVIGGGAVAGAIIGGITGGKSGAVKGAVVGAGAGTGAVLVTKGQEVEMPAGSRWVVRTRNALRL